ncbi:DNA/RNA non-specific endonuclease [Flavobacterium restrictum]|uniref:DNA/RNA non-specific endonuclease n=1 Tax=Flavobacterium restrictum TaxID=2594428 RepID=A0A553DWK6_9FLAO|nr:DNA/RNA non-specific endonuclease [Flavobacterium restrictum]TRX37082.1 DNA/RNA non-specific endonuclease [Flavobacterium restrictum]
MRITTLFLSLSLLFNGVLISCQNNNTAVNITSSARKISKPKVQEGFENTKGFFDYLPTSTTKQLVKHEYYTVSYNEKYEQAEWVAYELKKEYGSNTHFKRPFFIEDPQVATGSADWRNYKNSGYDKGHLCPAGDMEFSKAAYDDTFFTSNISPQIHEFNDGIWNRLEQKTRYWASKYNGIYVVTGGVLKDNLKTIGKEKVAVPDYFYKVLLNNTNGNYKMIAFLVPNQKSEKPLYDFVVSVAVLEKMTGIDFYPNLPDDIESNLEKNTNYKEWSFD